MVNYIEREFTDIAGKPPFIAFGRSYYFAKILEKAMPVPEVGTHLRFAASWDPYFSSGNRPDETITFTPTPIGLVLFYTNDCGDVAPLAFSYSPVNTWVLLDWMHSYTIKPVGDVVYGNSRIPSCEEPGKGEIILYAFIFAPSDLTGTKGFAEWYIICRLKRGYGLALSGNSIKHTRGCVRE